MIPGERDMLAVVAAIEREYHLEGWDRPSVLGLVFQEPGGGFGVVPYPVQPADLPFDNPVEGLLHLAQMLARWGGASRAKIADQIAGVWLLSEAWTLPPEKKRKGVRNVDTPGARECRFVALVDCGGRLYHAFRVRGEDPEAEQVNSGDTRAERALRLLLAALASGMSAGSVDVEAVAGR
jgi:hypothetical protein